MHHRGPSRRPQRTSGHHMHARTRQQRARSTGERASRAAQRTLVSIAARIIEAKRGSAGRAA